MGVTGLWKLIDQSGKPVPVDTLENKVLAVGMYYFHNFTPEFHNKEQSSILIFFSQIFQFGCIK